MSNIKSREATTVEDLIKMAARTRKASRQPRHVDYSEKLTELRDVAAETGSSFAGIYSDDVTQRIELMRHGLPAATVDVLSQQIGMPKESIYRLLGTSKATVARQAKVDAMLDTEATERAVFIAGLTRIIEEMIPSRTRAATHFDAAKWLGQWLQEPLPALGGKAPESFVDTADGRNLVRRALQQMETGAYA